ncbi:MAG: tRNA lysidine(34) synthetase TilS [Firmicutes bacterium HGW-Firmicutes-21]|nr:MAG: tRNA lysidine(34) synthetase TilS [Firmicutes bacterium HGW-Firmicutes-21]
MNDLSDIYLNKVSVSLVNICGDLSGKKLCVGLSGGADSVAMLYALNELKEKFNFDLCAAHVNHLLRGDEAYRDEEFCVELCKSLGIELFSVHIDINKLIKVSKRSVEETARDARYAYFEELQRSKQIDLLATAHTKNDNAETVLMNIIRGTSVSGICGIPQKNRNVIRPLLNIVREENIAFLKENGLSYVTDGSNLDNAYTRNYIRNITLPTIKKINPQVIESINRLSTLAKSDEDFFDNMLDSIPDEVTDTELHPALLRRRLQRDYAAATSGKSLLTVHLEALMRLPFCQKGRSLSMPEGITASIKDGRINFVSSKNIKKITDNGIYELKYGENSFADGRVIIQLYKFNSDRVQNIYNNDIYIKLSFGKIVGSVKYRARQTGDKIYCLGVNRSIKKEFIARGVPSYLRECIPVFFDDDGIVYVPFIGAADRVYTADDASDTVIISFRFSERQD